MSTLRAQLKHKQYVDHLLRTHDDLGHLRTRHRGNAIIIESGPEHEPLRHARLRRTTVHRWALDIANHRERWEPTPYTDTLDNLLAQLLEEFPWAVAPASESQTP